MEDNKSPQRKEGGRKEEERKMVCHTGIKKKERGEQQREQARNR